MVRGFTVDGGDISFMLHESLKHSIDVASFILHVLCAIRGLYGCVFMSI